MQISQSATTIVEYVWNGQGTRDFISIFGALRCIFALTLQNPNISFLYFFQVFFNFVLTLCALPPTIILNARCRVEHQPSRI